MCAGKIMSMPMLVQRSSIHECIFSQRNSKEISSILYPEMFAGVQKSGISTRHPVSKPGELRCTKKSWMKTSWNLDSLEGAYIMTLYAI